MFPLYVIGFRNNANIYYTGLHIHHGGEGCNFRNNKSPKCCTVLNIKEPRRKRFLTLHPELQSGLCDSLQSTHCSRTRYDETYENKSYLSQLQSHRGPGWHSGLGAVLQIGRSLVRSQLVSLDFSLT